MKNLAQKEKLFTEVFRYFAAGMNEDDDNS